MSTSNSTGFPVTTYFVPSEANMLADNRVSFARGQQHNQANVSDAIELISAKNTYVYLFYKTEKCYPHAYHALSSMHTFLAIDLRAFAAQQSGLEYLSGTPDGKISFRIFGTTLEDELLEWADGHGKGIFGIRREDLANRSAHADRVRRLFEYSSTRFVPPVPIIPRADQCYPGAHLTHCHSTTSVHPVSGRIHSHRPNQPNLARVEPLQSPFHWVEPKTTNIPVTSTLTSVKRPNPSSSDKPTRSPTRPERSDTPDPHRENSIETAVSPKPGSPSNPINVDDTDMINQLYAGTYNLGDDNPPTPQSDTSSNTRQKYHQGVRNNAPYCQHCGWSDHRTYYCEAYYCPDCDRRTPGHSFNRCPICMENKDRVLMEGLHGDVSYDNSYNMDGEGTKFW
ncbi:hypothetical protein SERLA73DRAFT_76426 [Serpula lacrymans var. lacrymans S7.3]|uniref:Uncharacterized protein n=2 Tax=Serpula lacrymans var. lacrymans TaxID=341189 RepID=F8Q5J8_SERL3|nr:uncharacterized protein SERLADRAFT_441242 [Serpula lacrymans var. lacrymans S7.9]EGN96469.1 hypothetical protein SERLA73DRAFT_76426 [Serpula lacrymans var. lacrymans S7.3]EGO22018.1 hypothetical protein SERLADRAFT_441242 [Serpula lacrymans var. lacrymans S7.9]